MILKRLQKLLKPKSRVIHEDHMHSVIVCGGCLADVHLPKIHWGHPTPQEDVTHWVCPPCVNKDRANKGKRPIGPN